MWTGPDAVMANTPAMNTDFAYTPSGEMVPSNVPSNITGAAIEAPPAPSTLQNLAEGYGRNAAAAGRGLANLTGLGSEGLAGVSNAANGFGSFASLSNTAAPIVVGGMGLADIQAQEDLLNQQQASGTVSTTDYNAQMARINEAKARATTAMNENPYKFAEGGEVKGYAFGGGIFQSIADKIQSDPSFLTKMQSAQSTPSSNSGGFSSGLLQQIMNNPSIVDKLKGITQNTPQALAEKALKENPYQFAMGGNVQMNPLDDQTGMPTQTPMQNFEQGGSTGYGMKSIDSLLGNIGTNDVADAVNAAERQG
jgi:hypothetical protein